MRVGYGLSVLLIITSSGCVTSLAVTCDDGTVCPRGTQCVAAPSALLHCAAPEQLAACSGAADGTDCEFALAMETEKGQCFGGACTTDGCGNNILDFGEACDDGNRTSGDGCRADCRKIEHCGDALVDQGEACDDGNDNPADGCDACRATAWTATTLVGGTPPPFSLDTPRAVAADAAGNLFIADTSHDVILRLDKATGVLARFAGNETSGFSGDEGPATSAQLDTPTDVAVDGFGAVYIADSANRCIREVRPDGTITTVAGIGGVIATDPHDGDGQVATSARFRTPYGVALDGYGDLFVADASGATIRRVDGLTRVITTIAGTGVAGASDTGVATTSQLDDPHGVAVGPDGALYVADSDNDKIRRVDLATGAIATVAGTGTQGALGDGGAATSAQLNRPYRIAFPPGSTGAFAIADTFNARIRFVSADGMISTIAGFSFGYGGDGNPATFASLLDPSGFAFTSATEFYIADSSNHRIRNVDAAGVIHTAVGTGSSNDGDLGPLATQLSNPQALAVAADGSLLIADTTNSRVRRLALDGTFTTIAGDGSQIGALGLPRGIVFVGDVLYITDVTHGRIVRLETTGALTGVASTVGSATSLAADAAGNLYFGDSLYNVVRRVDATTHAVTIVAGTSSTTGGFAGDGAAATAAQLWNPAGVAFDAAGDLVIADKANARVRRVDHTTGLISTIAGGGATLGDNGPATSARLIGPIGVGFDAAGNLYIGDSAAPGGNRVRKVDTGGTITTYVGNGISGTAGDGAMLSSATTVGTIYAFAFGAGGEMYLADYAANRVRRIGTDRVITTIAGRVDPRGTGPRAIAQLADPRALVATAAGTLLAAGNTGTVELLDDVHLSAIVGRYPQKQATADLARFRDTTFPSVGGIAYDGAGAGRLFASAGDALWLVQPPVGGTIAPLADTAGWRGPTGMFFDAANHRLLVADTGNHAIRAVDLATSAVATVAGAVGQRGDGTLLNGPEAVFACARTGDVFVADTANHRVRRIDRTTGAASTVVGIGAALSTGDGAPAASFPVDTPRGLACDSLGNLYVTSRTSVRLVEADVATGVVDGSLAVHTVYRDPSACFTGIAVVDDHTLEVTDACRGLLVRLVNQ